MSNATAIRASRFVGRPFRAVDPSNDTALAARAMPTARKGRPTRVAEVISLSCVWLITLCCSATAADEPVDFGKQIAPILEQHCVRCHSPGNSKGDVSLATLDDLKSNEYVVAGDADGSYLIELVTSQDGEPPAMPKKAKPLTDDEVALLRQWIEQGAKWPSDVVVKEKAKADASWWSLQPLSVDFRSAKAANLDATFAEQKATPKIDDFIRDRLNQHALTFSPQADRRTLIRRLSFDLHGLPPTPEAVDAFVNDPDPHAYEKLVDRMLESPHYGERFAQHWLDIAHYADTHGFERDMANGRGPLRRLNRDEYEQNLRDVLQLALLDIRDMLPEDREAHRFNKTAAALDMSRVQLAAYLDAADAALRQAMASGPEPPPVTKYRAAGTQLFSATSTFGEREARFFAKDNKAVDTKELEPLKDDPALELSLFRSAHWPYFEYTSG